MKKVRQLVLLLTALLLFGCAAVPQTSPASVTEYMEDEKEIRAYIYESDDTYVFSPAEAFLSLLKGGEWTEKSGRAKGEKLLSIMAEEQYEICFFEDGTAMIYYGYVGLSQRDRRYYTFSPKESIEEMIRYITEHGTIDENNKNQEGGLGI